MFFPSPQCNLTRNQFSALRSEIRIFVKKNSELTESEIYNKFFDELNYQIALGQFTLPWIEFCWNDESFLHSVKTFVKEYKAKSDYKLKMKPLVDEQKKYAGIMRQKQIKHRQSKEKPTCKQIVYYNSLCKKLRIDKKDTTNLSKADLINLISEVLNNGGKN